MTVQLKQSAVQNVNQPYSQWLELEQKHPNNPLKERSTFNDFSVAETDA